MMNYSKLAFNDRRSSRQPVVPQTQPLPGMVANNGGGFGFKIDKFDMVTRFLLIGTEGGTYYASEKKITKDNAKNVVKCIKEDGKRVVDMALEISKEGRAPKNDPAIFVLALCASCDQPEVRAYAFSKLNEICRVGTHVMTFIEQVLSMRGCGRGMRRALSNWYNDKDLKSVVFQAIKYQNRNGWSQRDILRLAHPEFNSGKTLEKPRLAIYNWIKKGENPKTVSKSRTEDYKEACELIEGFEAAKKATPDEIASIVKQYRLPMECVPTDKQNSEVWELMIEQGGLTFLLRNLGNLSKYGMFDNPALVRKVESRFMNMEALKKARIHPIDILIALKTYSQGHGERGKSTWNVNQKIVEMLNNAFYLSFGTITPTNKRLFLGVDVSGSMTTGNIAGLPGMTPRMLACAMAMITYKTEPNTCLMAFSNNLMAFDISKCTTLEKVMQVADGMSFSHTNCALPMLGAAKERIPFDAFIIYTDNETNSNSMHPIKALEKYHREVGVRAKLIVNAFTASSISIADPDNPDCLDICGFDSAVPQLMNTFIG